MLSMLAHGDVRRRPSGAAELRRAVANGLVATPSEVYGVDVAAVSSGLVTEPWRLTAEGRRVWIEMSLREAGPDGARELAYLPPTGAKPSVVTMTAALAVAIKRRLAWAPGEATVGKMAVVYRRIDLSELGT